MTVKWRNALLALACFAIHRTEVCSATRPEFPLRPSTDLGPIPDLIEMPNPALDPKPSDLNTTVLLSQLGGKFDPNFMSIMAPERIVPVTKVPYRRNRRGRLVPVGKMPPEINSLDTKYFELSDGRKLRTRISGRLRRKILQYLWGRTGCPVRRQWKDLGQRFWPRWLLEGSCPKGETSCSVPAGMYCRATANQHKTLLRWHCKSGGGGLGGGGPSSMLQQYNSLSGVKAATANAIKVCQWIKVEYPVVTECGCGCAVEPADSSD